MFNINKFFIFCILLQNMFSNNEEIKKELNKDVTFSDSNASDSNANDKLLKIFFDDVEKQKKLSNFITNNINLNDFDFVKNNLLIGENISYDNQKEALFKFEAINGSLLKEKNFTYEVFNNNQVITESFSIVKNKKNNILLEWTFNEKYDYKIEKDLKFTINKLLKNEKYLFISFMIPFNTKDMAFENKNDLKKRIKKSEFFLSKKNDEKFSLYDKHNNPYVQILVKLKLDSSEKPIVDFDVDPILVFNSFDKLFLSRINFYQLKIDK